MQLEIGAKSQKSKYRGAWEMCEVHEASEVCTIKVKVQWVNSIRSKITHCECKASKNQGYRKHNNETGQHKQETQ